MSNALPSANNKNEDACSDEQLVIARKVLHYSEQLLDAQNAPNIPEEFSNDEQFQKYQAKLLGLREILFSFSRGDFSPTITQRGVVAGACKALQANLRHLVWKVQQVEKGDYSQRVDFMGDFSSAFNSMVVQLDTTIEVLKQKEEALTALAVSLQEEARKRSEALQELKKSEAKFKYLAQYDSLTGTLNRRQFFTLAETQMQAALSKGESCCVALLDVDYFKVFNDTYGHMEGDLALKHIVAQSMSSLRQTDSMGRFGGEEFIFFFYNTERTQGMAAAERIRQAIAFEPFILENGSSVNLTVSMGVTEVKPDGHLEQIIDKKLKPSINLADQALYMAKATGRNKVCFAEK